MTNQDLTLIAALVDRSGSMQSCRTQMQDGLNEFIGKQASFEGRAEITLAQFDDRYDVVWPIMPLSGDLKYTLEPRGMTAMLDAMGRFITDVGSQLKARPEAQRPDKVIVCIVTDGLENASREWTRDRVRALVQQQKDQWNWEFVFLGANMDAVAEAAKFGICRESALTFNTANAGVSYAAMNNYVGMTRSGLKATFSDAERSAAVK